MSGRSFCLYAGRPSRPVVEQPADVDDLLVRRTGVTGRSTAEARRGQRVEDAVDATEDFSLHVVRVLRRLLERQHRGHASVGFLVDLGPLVAALGGEGGCDEL